MKFLKFLGIQPFCLLPTAIMILLITIPVTGTLNSKTGVNGDVSVVGDVVNCWIAFTIFYASLIFAYLIIVLTQSLLNPD